MPEQDTSSDESIGRPSEWREGRYEKDPAENDKTVLKKPGEMPDTPDIDSTPVTRKDYE